MAPNVGQCVICFESTSQSAVLPCSCKVDYCTRCWDRALAESFNACDQARCPTCRSPVRVDFDDERGCLLFSREDDPPKQHMSPEEALAMCCERRRETVERLLEKARPVQVRLLQSYGAQHPELRRMVEEPEAHINALPADELRRLLASMARLSTSDEQEPSQLPADAPQDALARGLLHTAGNESAVAACWASTAADRAMPSCVCGSTLRRVSRMDRVKRICETMFPGAPLQEMVEIILSGQCDVVCDICANQVRTCAGIWTCENGDSTIFHATAYDVCDTCFVANTCREASLPVG